MAKFERANQSAFSVVVTTDLGPYKQDQVLTKPMDIADYLRECCSAADVVLTLDDDQIVAIAKSMPANSMNAVDWELEVCSVLESRNKPNDRSPRDVALPDTRSITDVRIASGSVAGLIGEKFDANENFRNVLHTAAYATEVVKASPLRLLLSTFDIYGLTVDNEGNVKDIEHSRMFDEIPHPSAIITKDSEYWKKNGKVLPADQNKFSEYPKLVGKDLIKYDWFAEMFAATAEGKAIEAEVKEWQLAREGKGKTPTGRYANKLQDEVVNKLALWKLRWSTGVKFLRMAIEACYQWRDILTLMHGKIGVQLGMEGHGTEKAQVSEGFTTIVIYNAVAKGRTLSQALTISGFNNLDIDKAIEKGGTFVDLRDSSQSGARETPDNLWEEGDIKIEALLDNLPQLSEFLRQGGAAQLMAKADAKDKNTRERTESAKDIIVEVMDMMFALSRFADMHGTTYQDIKVERAEADRKERDAIVAKQKAVA